MLTRFTPPSDRVPVVPDATTTTTTTTAPATPPQADAIGIRYHLQLAHNYELQVICAAWNGLVSLVQQIEAHLVPSFGVMVEFIVRHVEQYRVQLPFITAMTSYGHSRLLLLNHPQVCSAYAPTASNGWLAGSLFAGWSYE